MNVLLISPEAPDTFWSFRHALKIIHKRSCIPPLGLLTVAAMLPAEWNLRLVDCGVRALKAKDLAWADLAMIGAMLVHRDSARQIAARCKAAGLTVVAGGPLYSDAGERTAQVDHYVLGEAEVTLQPFLDDLARGEAKPLYETGEFPELGNTPVPRWDLAPLKRYASACVQYSRGCPFNCDFCNVTALFGHRPRTKSVAQVIAELDALWAAGWRDTVFFVDDNFIGNTRKLKTGLLPALTAWRKAHPGITFYTEVSINLADDAELMAMMGDAGFNKVFIGIETPCDMALAECGKSQNHSRDLVADVKRMQRAGLQVQGGFIVGFDSDTPSIFQRQIDFIQQSGIATAMVGLLQAIPGTRLFERMQNEGRLRGDSSGNNVDGTTNIITRMDPQALSEGYREILRHIYAPKNYYQRVRNFLQEYSRPKAGMPLRFEDVMAFVRSIWRLGIVGRERLHYWRLLVWTTWHRPELFSTAVVLAIYGFHFRKTCKTLIGTGR